ncbi:hypothetical protein EDM53_00475 [Rickettsiales endosymbiont of Peranema trichophorum]|uniref:hypothetical protein n=1 Tax=Rickettsiales endosymbiont of Peranema trichophorum TaxID=2486577 RepID=UPI001023C586|nr:hypothetical protein [Rickettsiales endosymbiont of Peranema trichophorum]RZI47719.1 hypothetical protein EDM53_00475 [Rickettsiales endosymbiont of Peranema trichophorum]
MKEKNLEMSYADFKQYYAALQAGEGKQFIEAYRERVDHSLTDEEVMSLALMKAIQHQDVEAVGHILNTAPLKVLTIMHCNGYSPISLILDLYRENHDILGMIERYLLAHSDEEKVELTEKELSNMSMVVEVPMLDLITLEDNLEYLKETFLQYLYTPETLEHLQVYYYSQTIPYSEEATSGPEEQEAHLSLPEPNLLPIHPTLLGSST